MALNEVTYRTAAIEFINYYLDTTYTDGETLPALVEVATDMMIKGFKENPTLASQTLGDMSKSFFQGDGYFLKAKKILDTVKGELGGKNGTGKVKFY